MKYGLRFRRGVCEYTYMFRMYNFRQILRESS